MGHGETLARSPPWNNLLQHARAHNCLYVALPPFSSVLKASQSALLAGTYQASKQLSVKPQAHSVDASKTGKAILLS